VSPDLVFTQFDHLVNRVTAIDKIRVIVAVAGPPGAGKSTLAEALVEALNRTSGNSAAVIPMDGFHYDDAVLEARGLKARKGSPSTFDVASFGHLLKRLKSNDENEVAIPVFDRSLEISRAAARIVSAEVKFLVVEGNYLLLRDEPWNKLADLFDLTVMIEEPGSILENRLMSRWISYGFGEAEARGKVLGNDLPNVDLVMQQSTTSDMVVSSIHQTFNEVRRVVAV
jgi:pantothenate kinase